MGHGGARAKAGRPKGSSRNRRSIAAAIKTVNEIGVTPIEVMLGTMAAFWDMAIQAAEDVDYERAITLCVAASAIAKDAAPYVHPRLAAIEHKVDGAVKHILSDKPMEADEWKRQFTNGHQLGTPARTTNGADKLSD